MFNLKVTKSNRKGGEDKMKNIMIIMLTAVLVLGFCGSSFAANLDSATIDVVANVPAYAGVLDYKIHKVTSVASDCTGASDTWDKTEYTSVNFDKLFLDQSLDPDTKKPYNVIRTVGGFYYAVDVSVLDNKHTTWTITHNVTSFNGAVAGSNLNYNVNVGFDKVIAGTGGANDTDKNIVKKVFANSNGVTITKAQLMDGTKQGWLRIYYGLATGKTTDKNPDCSVDATGALPILSSQSPGEYRSKVTLTLSA